MEDIRVVPKGCNKRQTQKVNCVSDCGREKLPKKDCFSVVGARQPKAMLYEAIEEEANSEHTSDSVFVGISTQDSCEVTQNISAKRSRRTRVYTKHDSAAFHGCHPTKKPRSQRQHAGVSREVRTAAQGPSVDRLLVLHQVAVDVLHGCYQEPSHEADRMPAPPAPRRLSRAGSSSVSRTWASRTALAEDEPCPLSGPSQAKSHAPAPAAPAPAASALRKRGRSELHGPCDHCGVQESPQWRKGPKCKPVLCNACGTRFLRTRSLGKQSTRCSKAPEDSKTTDEGAAVGGGDEEDVQESAVSCALKAEAVEDKPRAAAACEQSAPGRETADDAAPAAEHAPTSWLEALLAQQKRMQSAEAMGAMPPMLSLLPGGGGGIPAHLQPLLMAQAGLGGVSPAPHGRSQQMFIEAAQWRLGLMLASMQAPPPDGGCGGKQ